MKKTMISNIRRKWSRLVKLLLSYLISVTSDDDSISHKDYEMHKGREWMMAVIRAVLSQPLLFNFLKTFKDFVLLCLRPVLNEWLITSIRRLWLFIRLQVCMKSHHGAVFFAAQLYSGAEMHIWSVILLQLAIILNLSDFIHLLDSNPAWPDSPQVGAYPVSHQIPGVQTQLYIFYSPPFMHCVLRLLLGKICRAVEFDPHQNKLRCTVLAVLSSRDIQPLTEAMWCWLDLRAHLTAHTYMRTLIPMGCRQNWKVCKKALFVCADALLLVKSTSHLKRGKCSSV